MQDEMLFRGEDVDYNWRVRQLGYHIYYDPGVIVKHHHRPTIKHFFYQYYMYGRAYYLVRSKWPEMYCVFPHRFRKPKDFLKMINFFFGVFYQSFIFASRLRSIWEWVPGYSVLWLAGVVWRIGIIYQAIITLGANKLRG